MWWEYAKKLGREEVALLKELRAYAQKYRWRTRWDDENKQQMVEEAYCLALNPNQFSTYSSDEFAAWQQDNKIKTTVVVCHLEKLLQLESLGILITEKLGRNHYPTPIENGTVTYDANDENPPIIIGALRNMPYGYGESMYRAVFTSEYDVFAGNLSHRALLWCLSRFELKTNLDIFWSAVSGRDWFVLQPYSWFFLATSVVVFVALRLFR